MTDTALLASDIHIIINFLEDLMYEKRLNPIQEDFNVPHTLGIQYRLKLATEIYRQREFQTGCIRDNISPSYSEVIEYMVGKLNAERHRIAKNITNEKTF